MKKALKKKKKKDEPLYFGYMYLCSRKIFPKPNFAGLFRFDDVINRAKYFFNQFTRVAMARGQT